MQLENQGEHDRGHVHRADLLCALDFDATSLKRGEERRGEEKREEEREKEGGEGGEREKRSNMTIATLVSGVSMMLICVNQSIIS